MNDDKVEKRTEQEGEKRKTERGGGEGRKESEWVRRKRKDSLCVCVSSEGRKESEKLLLSFPSYRSMAICIVPFTLQIATTLTLLFLYKLPLLFFKLSLLSLSIYLINSYSTSKYYFTNCHDSYSTNCLYSSSNYYLYSPSLYIYLTLTLPLNISQVLFLLLFFTLALPIL